MLTVKDLWVENLVGLKAQIQLTSIGKASFSCSCADDGGGLARAEGAESSGTGGVAGEPSFLSRELVEHAIRIALALNCRIASTTVGRQDKSWRAVPGNGGVSQLDLPITFNGRFEFPIDSRLKRIGIRRIRLVIGGQPRPERGGSASGGWSRRPPALLEVVTEPELHSAQETREFAVQLRRLVRYLGMSDGDISSGRMRFYPSVNLRMTDKACECCTPIVSVRGLGSLSDLELAVDHEIGRQLEEWRGTGATATPRNRRIREWDEAGKVTVAAEANESCAGHGADPVAVPLAIDREWVAALKDSMPELPICRTERFIAEYKLPRSQAAALVDDRATADLLDDAADAGADKTVLARQFIGFWLELANERRTTIAGLGVSPGRLAELANLVQSGDLPASEAGRVAADMLCCYGSARAVAGRLAILCTHAQAAMRAV